MAILGENSTALSLTILGADQHSEEKLLCRLRTTRQTRRVSNM